jgi:acetyl esterase
MTAVVDPAMQVILDTLRRAPAVDLRTLPMPQARAAFIARQTQWTWSRKVLAEIRDCTVHGAVGNLRARLYCPTATPNLPVVIFVHGGGWTFGDVDTHDGTMRALAIYSGCAVLGFDYRLAPEHPFPAPLEDVLAVLAYVERGGLGKVCDSRRIALAGDSAGANLALGAILKCHSSGTPLPATAALFYGCYAPNFDTPSHRRCGDGTYLLSTDMMRWYWANFLGPTNSASPPPACAPLLADLSELTGLPPLYLNAAGLDPLIDDTMQLSSRLAAAGVRHTLDVWPGVVHGFLRLAHALPAAEAALAAAGHFLQRALNENEEGSVDRNERT